ncbi:MAG: GNAT family N-acetyltransferase [Candidatus Dormibacteria bacterium]
MTIEPAGPERWGDVVEVFAGASGRPSSCWCQRFLARSQLAKRAALQREIETAELAPALLACVDGSPAGWTRVMPRRALPGVSNNRALRRVLADDPDAWWVTCFAIRRQYRACGVGTTLLKAAVSHAGAHGASCVEGHPVDASARRAARMSPSALFTGTMSMFQAAGFREVARTFPSRPLMHIDLAQPPT